MYDKLSEVFKCVKCGKCLPVCPIYELSPDEYSGARGKCLIIKFFLDKKIEISTNSFRKILSKCCYCLRCQARCQVGIDFKAIIPLARFLSLGGELKRFDVKAVLDKKNKNNILFVRSDDLNKFKELFPHIFDFFSGEKFKVVFYDKFLRGLFFDRELDVDGVFDKIEPYLGDRFYFLDSLDGFLLQNFFFELFFNIKDSLKLKNNVSFLEELFLNENILAPFFLEMKFEGYENISYNIPFELVQNDLRDLALKKFGIGNFKGITFYPPFFQFF